MRQRLPCFMCSMTWRWREVLMGAPKGSFEFGPNTRSSVWASLAPGEGSKYQSRWNRTMFDVSGR